MRYQKKAAILVLSIVCFLLTLAASVLGDPTPQTTLTPAVMQQPEQQNQAAQPIEATQPSTAPVQEVASTAPAAPVQAEQTATAQPVQPAVPAPDRTASAPSTISTQTPSHGVSTIPTQVPAAASKLSPMAQTKPAQIGLEKPAITAPKPMQHSYPKVTPAPKPAPKPVRKITQSPKSNPGFIAKALSATRSLMNHAVSWLGTRYVWGGVSKAGVDCSGLMKLLFKGEGVNLPRVARQQFQRGIAVARAALMPGDLVFFNTNRGPITHVGIYIGNGQFLHAANPRRGVRIDSLGSSYYTKRFAGARRILNLG